MVTASNKSSEINPNPQHTGYRHLQYIQSYLAHPWRELHTTIQCTHRVRLRQPSDPRIFKIWCTQRYKLSQHSWSSIKAAFWSKTIQNLMQVTFLLSSQYKGINEWSHLTCHSDSSDCCRQKEELLTRDDCIFGNEAMSVTIFRFHITFFFSSQRVWTFDLIQGWPSHSCCSHMCLLQAPGKKRDWFLAVCYRKMLQEFQILHEKLLIFNKHLTAL